MRNADHFLARCPENLVPPWDFDVPPGPDRIDDSSAAAIAASGLWNLAAPGRTSRTRRRRATATPRSRSSTRSAPTATSPGPCPGWEGVLKHGVYHFHKKLGVDESVMWGDFFFLEASTRSWAPAGRAGDPAGSREIVGSRKFPCRAPIARSRPPS